MNPKEKAIEHMRKEGFNFEDDPRGLVAKDKIEKAIEIALNEQKKEYETKNYLLEPIMKKQENEMKLKCIEAIEIVSKERDTAIQSLRMATITIIKNLISELKEKNKPRQSEKSKYAQAVAMTWLQEAKDQIEELK